MTQYRHLYWDSGNKDLRMFTDSGSDSIEVLSYYIRKRYAYLLDTVSTTPGIVGLTQPSSEHVVIGGAINSWRTSGSHTEVDDNLPASGAEPDSSFTSDQTAVASATTVYYQNQDHTTAAPAAATINNMGLLYWTTPDLKIGPTSETDLRDTLANHCLTQMETGDEVGTYRVATSDPGGGTWSNKGTFFSDTKYLSFGSTTVQADYRLWLKTANTTEPSSPDNYTRWDDANAEIQLESSTDYSATAKLVNLAYLDIIQRRHPEYTVSGTNSGTLRGTFYDKIHQLGSFTNVLTGPAGGYYTRTYEPTGTIVDNNGPYYLNISGQRTP